MSSRAQALLEFAVTWPLLLLLTLGSVQLAIWAEQAFAARHAAAAGARAGAARESGEDLALDVAQAALGPVLGAVRLSRWCPGTTPAPDGVWLCATQSGRTFRVRVGGRVPALVPLVPGAPGLPLHADVTVDREVFE